MLNRLKVIHLSIDLKKDIISKLKKLYKKIKL